MDWLDVLTAAAGIVAGWWLRGVQTRRQVRRAVLRERDHLTAPGSEPKP